MIETGAVSTAPAVIGKFDLLSLQDYMDFYAVMIYDITMKCCERRK